MTRGWEPPLKIGRILGAIGKVICFVLLFFGWQQAVMIAFRAAIQNSLRDSGPYWEQQAYDLLLEREMEILLISSLLTLLSVVLLVRVIRRKKLTQSLWLRPPCGSVMILCVILGICLYCLLVVILSFLPEGLSDSYNESAARVSQTGAVAVIVSALAAPVTEEIIFRGLVYTRLREVMPACVSVLISALIFGMGHTGIVWISYAFAFGILFAALDEKTGSIFPGILIHIAVNSANETVQAVTAGLSLTYAGFLVFLMMGTAGTICSSILLRKHLMGGGSFHSGSARPSQKTSGERFREKE